MNRKQSEHIVPADPAEAAEPRVQLKHAFTIWQKGEVVASCDIEKRHGHYWLMNLWTHHNYRRRGYADALIRAALAGFRDRPIYLAALGFEDRMVGDDDLVTFYAESGFEQTAVPGVMVRPAPIGGPG